MQIVELPITLIRNSSHRVRREVTPESIGSLAQSMNDIGILHPILVKRCADSESDYELVAGYRRLEAARELKLENVPAIVLESGVPARQVQLVENLQREDLDPVERALGVHEFMVAEKLTKVAAAQRLGVPRTTLTEWLNVIDIPERYQEALIDNARGGDSPLTVSHVSEAKGLANRLRSSYLIAVILDAVLEFRLSKAETREVCAIVRENKDISVNEAVLNVRRPTDVNTLGPEYEDSRMAVERNLDKWRFTLDRSMVTLSELGRVSPRYLAPSERQRMMHKLQQLEALVSEALQQMSDKVS